MDTPTQTPIRRGHRRSLMLLAVACVAVVSMLVVGPAAALPPGPRVRVANSQASFAGTTLDEATGETVDLVGTLHVRTLLAGSDARGWTVVWLASVGHATGTGETTGDRYVLTGIDAGVVRFPPGPPVRPALFEPTLALRHPGSGFHPPSPCRLLVALSFDAVGLVTAVQVHVADSVIGPID